MCGYNHMNKICYSLSRFLFTSGRFLVRSIIIFGYIHLTFSPLLCAPYYAEWSIWKKQIHVKSIWGQVVFCVNDAGVESGPVSLNPSIRRWCRVARGADSYRLLAIGGKERETNSKTECGTAWVKHTKFSFYLSFPFASFYSLIRRGAIPK